MAKKLGKALLATAIIGTAAAGAYYYLKKKKEDESFDFDSADASEETKTTRNYVPLNFEKAGEKVNVFVSKAGDVFEKTVDMVKQKVAGTNDDVVEEFVKKSIENANSMSEFLKIFLLKYEVFIFFFISIGIFVIIFGYEGGICS